MRLEAMRPGNRRAFDVILKRLREGEPTTSIVKPTRYGKRDLIITSCWQAVEDGIVSGGLVFSPAAQATRQFFKERKLLETIHRYDLPAIDVLQGVGQLKSFNDYQPFSDGVFLLAANIQLCLRTNIEDCCDLIRSERHRTGKPLVIFIDECQFVAEQQQWGKFFREVLNAGALLVLVTATPYRIDADAMPGFHVTTVDPTDERRWIPVDAGDGVHTRIDVWDGIRCLTMLEADDTTTFREAWKEVPLPLCLLDRETVSIEINGKPLKELSNTETKKQLWRIVRDERFLEPAIRIVLEKLRYVQALDPSCKAMIMTGNDKQIGNDRRDNAHAETVKRLLLELAPIVLGRQCRVRIITLKTVGDELAAKVMEDCLDSDDDIVIVKQVGAVGLDDWRIKVLGYFSTTRAPAGMLQAWMRPATPHDGLQIAYLVMPDDCLCTAVWNKLVVEEGGEAKLREMSGWTATEWVDWYLKKKEEQPELDDLVFGPGGVGVFDDSQGNVGSPPFYGEATDLLEQFPRMSQVYTKAEIAKRLEESGRPPGENKPPAAAWGRERQLETLYRQINESADEKTNRLMHKRTGRYDAKIYREIQTAIFVAAYRSVGLRLGVRLRDIKNTETLCRIHEVIENISAETVEYA